MPFSAVHDELGQGAFQSLQFRKFGPDISKMLSSEVFHSLTCTCRFIREAAERDSVVNGKPEVTTPLDEAQL